MVTLTIWLCSRWKLSQLRPPCCSGATRPLGGLRPAFSNSVMSFFRGSLCKIYETNNVEGCCEQLVTGLKFNRWCWVNTWRPGSTTWSGQVTFEKVSGGVVHVPSDSSNAALLMQLLSFMPPYHPVKSGLRKRTHSFSYKTYLKCSWLPSQALRSEAGCYVFTIILALPRRNRNSFHYKILDFSSKGHLLTSLNAAPAEVWAVHFIINCTYIYMFVQVNEVYLLIFVQKMIKVIFPVCINILHLQAKCWIRYVTVILFYSSQAVTFL